jgi:hypothetical protein
MRENQALNRIHAVTSQCGYDNRFGKDPRSTIDKPLLQAITQKNRTPLSNVEHAKLRNEPERIAQPKIATWQRARIFHNPEQQISKPPVA